MIHSEGSLRCTGGLVWGGRQLAWGRSRKADAPTEMVILAMRIGRNAAARVCVKGRTERKAWSICVRREMTKV